MVTPRREKKEVGGKAKERWFLEPLKKQRADPPASFQCIFPLTALWENTVTFFLSVGLWHASSGDSCTEAVMFVLAMSCQTLNQKWLQKRLESKRLMNFCESSHHGFALGLGNKLNHKDGNS